MHLITDFADGQIQINQLYVFSNSEPTLFVGTSGDPSDGTVALALPEGAQNVVVERGFGSLDSFFPAEEVIEVAGGRADTMPLRPGTGSTILLVRYSLPYDNALSLSHPISYPAGGINLVLPDVGVTLVNDGQWSDMGQQAIEAGSFRSFTHGPIAAGESFSLALEGRPRPNASGAAARNSSTELAIGGAALLVVAVVAVLVVRNWRPAEADEPLDRDALLEEIAALDDAYESGEIDEKEYRRERKALKEELLALWEQE
jgi:hypothetical protein